MNKVKSLIVVSTASMMFVGCAAELKNAASSVSTGASNLASTVGAGVKSGYNSAKIKINDSGLTDKAATYIEGVGGGAVVGAVAGKLLGVDPRTAAAIGAALGAALAYDISNMQERYAGKEEQLIQKIAKVQKEQKEIKSRNDSLVQEISQLDSYISMLKQRNKITNSEKRQLLAKLTKTEKELNKMAKKSRNQKQNLSAYTSKVNGYDFSNKPEDKADLLNAVNKLSEGNIALQDSIKLYKKEIKTLKKSLT